MMLRQIRWDISSLARRPLMRHSMHLLLLKTTKEKEAHVSLINPVCRMCMGNTSSTPKGWKRLEWEETSGDTRLGVMVQFSATRPANELQIRRWVSTQESSADFSRIASSPQPPFAQTRIKILIGSIHQLHPSFFRRVNKTICA